MLLVVFTLLTLLLEAVSANFRFINPPHLDVSVDGDVPGRNDVYLYSSTLNIEWSLPSTPDSMMTLLLAWLPRDIPKGFYKSSNWMFARVIGINSYNWTVQWGQNGERESDYSYLKMFYDVPPQNIGIHNVTGAKKAITKLFYIVLEDDPVSTNVVTSVVTATIEPVTSTSALDPASDSATLTDTVMPIPGTPAPSSSSTASLPASSNSSAYSHFPWPIGLCRGCKAGLALAVLAGVVWCSSLAWYLTPGKEDVDDEDPPPYEEATHIEMATSLDVLIFFVLGGGFLCVVRLALARSRPRPTIYAVQQLCRSTTAVSNWTHDVERKQKQKCSRPIQAC